MQANGSWSTQVMLGASGTDTIVATDTDLAGNVGRSNLVAFTLLPPPQQSFFGQVTHDVTGPIGDIYALYETILARAPDPGGFSAFVATIESGTPPVGIAQGLLASPEFTAEFGAAYTQGSNTAFVDRLYANAFHREPDAGGLAAWDNALAGGLSRAQAAVDIALSPEHQDDLAPLFQTPAGVFVVSQTATEIAQLYYSILDRAPDTGGLAAWQNALAHGQPLSAIASSFLASTEYAQLHGSPDNAQFVTTLYEGALGREPDAGGLSGWATALDHGASRADIAVSLSEGPEATAHLAAQIASYQIA